jgi:hypothetical protein
MLGLEDWRIGGYVGIGGKKLRLSSSEIKFAVNGYILHV